MLQGICLQSNKLKHMSFLSMSDLSLANKRVFLRADLNVPLDERGVVLDTSRIKASAPAIMRALGEGAALMVTSHLGRPQEGIWDPKLSLDGVRLELSRILNRDVPLIKDWLDGVEVSSGEIVLLENCRFNEGEKNSDIKLSKKMAGLCDIFVNDAFATAHRKEATTFGIAQYAKIACAGPLMASEMRALSRALETPSRPLVAVVGGSKVSTKLPVLSGLASKVDHLIVGGGIANTFLLSQGHSIGESLVEKDLVSEASHIIDKINNKGGSCPLPNDVVSARHLKAGASCQVKDLNGLADNEMILDVGPNTIMKFEEIIKRAGTVVWNGPLGVFEIDEFSKGTKALGQAIENSNAFSIAGGGDTIAAINKFSLRNIDYISTAGGAFLEFLEGRKLPAFEVLYGRTR